jgi:hypothetical protein
MTNLNTVQNRYMKDPLPIRLGGLAANLARINTFSINPANKSVVESLINESKHFIEWTAPETNTDLKILLVELQVSLALWQLNIEETFSDNDKNREISKRAKFYSDEILKLSGLF